MSIKILGPYSCTFEMEEFNLVILLIQVRKSIQETHLFRVIVSPCSEIL